MVENPRQFSSLDSSDAGLHGSLTNRPLSGVPVGEPIDLSALNKQVINNRTTPGYEYKESDVERVLRLEREAEASRRIKQETADTNEKNRLMLEREQAQRQELANRIKNTPTDPEVSIPRGESPLAQQQRSTPERQPVPSRAAPPPTTNGTAARANPLVEPTAMPRPAIPAEAIPVSAGLGLGLALPRALPQAAGRLAVPGLLGGIDFANRVAHGQGIGQAAAGAAAGQIGAGIGFAIGSAVGSPLLGLAGMAVGGLVGGAIADMFFPAQLPSTGTPQTIPPNYPPFTGGQVFGALYKINHAAYAPDNSLYSVYESHLFGPIGDTTYSGNPERGHIKCSGSYDSSQTPVANTDYLLPFLPAGMRWKVTGLEQITVGFGGGGDLPGYHAPPPSNMPASYNSSPLNDDSTIPSGTPEAGKNKGQTRNIAPSMPTNNTPRGAPFFPGHGGLAPSYTPNPTQTPSNLGGMLPAQQSPALPLGFAEPKDKPIPMLTARPGLTVTPSTGGVLAPTLATVTPSSVTPATIGYAEGTDANGNYISPTGTVTAPDGTPLSSRDSLASGASLTPSSPPQSAQALPVPDANSPVPKQQAQPVPKTPEQAAADKTNQTIQQQKKDFDDQTARLTAIATAIAALTPAIQGIPNAIAANPNVRAANRDDVQGAVCEIAQPGGCLGARHDETQQQNTENGNRIDALNAALNGGNLAANAELLAGQQTILQRLGDQLPGGIGGKLSRFAEWMHLDRVLNILILAATIHNALMLSNDIGQTLIGALNNVLQLIGLKKENGEAFDIGSVISSSVENLIKGAIGADNYTNLTTAWAKANRIYQATTNILNSFQSLTSTVLNGLELVAGQTGKIGNALRASGEVLESAYQWMNPQPKINRVTNFLEGLQNGASTIQQVTQVPLDTINAITELQTANTEFVKAIKEDDKPENKAADIEQPDKLAADKETAKIASQGLELLDIDLEADE